LLPRMKTQAKKTRRSILDVRRSAAPGEVLDSTVSTSMVLAARQIFPAGANSETKPFQEGNSETAASKVEEID